MKAIILKPGKPGEVADLDPTYNNLRTLVGGNIEMTYPFEDEYIAVISNEEAKLLDLPPNRAVRREDGSIADIYCGVMVIVALDTGGEYRDLTDEEQDLVMEKWKRPEGKDDWGGAKPNMDVHIYAGDDALAFFMGGRFAMILQQIPEEELARIYIAIEPYVPQIEKRTGIRRKVIVETLIVSDFLLCRAADTPETAEISLDEFINRHCREVAAEVDLSVYDAMNIFTTRTEVMLEA